MSERAGAYERPFAVLGVGLPGLGKSEILRPYADSVGASFLSAADMRRSVNGGMTRRPVWNMLHDRAGELLRAGESIVVDAGHTNHERRGKEILEYRRLGALSVIAIEFQAVLEELAGRDVKSLTGLTYRALEEMCIDLSLHPPSVEEGFDEVVRIQASFRT